MKNNRIIIYISSIILILFLVSNAGALPTSISYGDTYLGAVSGDHTVFNNVRNTFADFEASWLGTYDTHGGTEDADILNALGYTIIDYAKYDGILEGGFNLTITPTVTFDGDEVAGTWSTSSGGSDYYVDIFVVKGSTYSAFLTGGPNSYGTWNTGYLPYVQTGGPAPKTNPKEWSYIRAVNTGAPVPEPTTMLLLGSGLLGLAAIGRKKFIK